MRRAFVLQYGLPTRISSHNRQTSSRLQAVAWLEFVTRTILSSLAQNSALGLRGDAFSGLLDNLPLAPLTISSSVLTFLRYGHCSDALHAEAHCDKGLLTAIFAPGCGLQVREPAWESILWCFICLHPCCAAHAATSGAGCLRKQCPLA